MVTWKTERSAVKTRRFVAFAVAVATLASFYGLTMLSPNATREVPLVVVVLPIVSFVSGIVSVRRLSIGELYDVWRVGVFASVGSFVWLVGIVAALGIQDGSALGDNLLLSGATVVSVTIMSVTGLTTIPLVVGIFNRWRSDSSGES